MTVATIEQSTLNWLRFIFFIPPPECRYLCLQRGTPTHCTTQYSVAPYTAQQYNWQPFSASTWTMTLSNKRKEQIDPFRVMSMQNKRYENNRPSRSTECLFILNHPTDTDDNNNGSTGLPWVYQQPTYTIIMCFHCVRHVRLCLLLFIVVGGLQLMPQRMLLLPFPLSVPFFFCFHIFVLVCFFCLLLQ